MTISSTTNRMDYTGNGATSTYSYTFKILDDDELLVTTRASGATTETTLTKTTDYTVTGVGVPAGGTIVLVAGNLASGTILTIRRVVELTQESDFRNQGSFYPEDYEDALDHLQMEVHQAAHDISGSVRLPETVDPADVDMRLPIPEAGALIGYNDDATEITTYTQSGIGTSSIPSEKGVLAHTGSSVLAARTITAGAGISVANGTGESGNPTITCTVLPAGSIVMYGVAAAPTGWLLCNGAAVSRTTYADLFAAIGTTFGSGNGSTTFNVPDADARFPLAPGTGLDGSNVYAIGDKGGEESHVILATELPSHDHDVATTSATHADGTEACVEVGGSGDFTKTESKGNSAAMMMLPPYICFNFIIKT